MYPFKKQTNITTTNWYDTAMLFALLIVVAQIVIAMVAYPFLPAIVPSHWNVAGQVDAYMPKFIYAILLPLTGIGTYLLLQLLMAISPRLGYPDQRTTRTITQLIAVGFLLFLLVVQVARTAIALGFAVNIAFVINLSLALLFIFIGNYLGKLRRNFWAGIRTPWTLVSDTVWERTHRLGGWLFVGMGVLGIVMSFIPILRLWALVVLALLVAAVLTVYSYIIYRHIEASGKEFLSPPFEDES